MKKIFIFILITIFMSGCSQKEAISENDSSVEDGTIVEEPFFEVYKDAKSLVEASSYVMSGKVIAIQNESIDIALEGDPHFVMHKVYELQIHNVYKGDYKEETIKIKDSYREIAYSRKEIGSRADVKVGEEYLFVLYDFKKSYLNLSSLTQSIYRLDGVDNEKNVIKDDAITLENVLVQFDSETE